MSANRLKLNADKTELLFTSKPLQLVPHVQVLRPQRYDATAAAAAVGSDGVSRTQVFTRPEAVTSMQSQTADTAPGVATREVTLSAK